MWKNSSPPPLKISLMQTLFADPCLLIHILSRLVVSVVLKCSTVRDSSIIGACFVSHISHIRVEDRPLSTLELPLIELARCDSLTTDVNVIFLISTCRVRRGVWNFQRASCRLWSWPASLASLYSVKWVAPHKGLWAGKHVSSPTTLFSYNCTRERKRERRRRRESACAHSSNTCSDVMCEHVQNMYAPRKIVPSSFILLFSSSHDSWHFLYCMYTLLHT